MRSFINVAKPLLTFVEPVPADTSRGFSLWDRLLVKDEDDPRGLEEINLGDIKTAIARRLDVNDDAVGLQSVSADDILIFADYLATEGDEGDASTIQSLLEAAAGDDATAVLVRAGCRGFLDLEVVATTDDSAEASLPPIRILVKPPN